jgi:hypothetical protein
VAGWARVAETGEVEVVEWVEMVVVGALHELGVVEEMRVMVVMALIAEEGCRWDPTAAMVAGEAAVRVVVVVMATEGHPEARSVVVGKAAVRAVAVVEGQGGAGRCTPTNGVRGRLCGHAAVHSRAVRAHCERFASSSASSQRRGACTRLPCDRCRSAVHALSPRL